MTDTSETGRKYWHGIDYLRALFIIFVVADNTGLVSSYLPSSNKEPFQLSILNILLSNILLLAVPGFMIISMFLFFSKKNETLSEDLPRLKQLSILYIFWVGLWILDRKQYPTGSIGQVSLYLVQGAYSPFYFIFSLILMTCIASVSRHLSRFKTLLLLFLSIVLVISFAILNINDVQYRDLIVHWNPIQFLPFVFAGKLIAEWEATLQKEDKFPANIILAIFALNIIISIGEWKLLYFDNLHTGLNPIMPPYGRVSLLVGAAGLLLSAIHINSPAPKGIKYLSDSSLGIYAIHMFVINYTNPILPTNPIIRSSVIFLLAIAITHFLKNLLNKRLL
jgi:surface polysaccharide O-acyltransferase-like enzyme